MDTQGGGEGGKGRGKGKRLRDGKEGRRVFEEMRKAGGIYTAAGHW
jgi:hypothetical protein